MRKSWLKLTQSKKIKPNTRGMCRGIELPSSQSKKNSIINSEIFFFTSLMLETEVLKGLNNSGLSSLVGQNNSLEPYHCLQQQLCRGHSRAAGAGLRQKQKQKPAGCRAVLGAPALVCVSPSQLIAEE